MAFKSYSLVAWTEEGKVRMVPSLVNEMKVPYEEKIARLESREYDDELEWLLERSRAWEEYAEFFLDLGYFRQAYRCYENAALSTTPGSDLLWVQDLDSERPVMPLYYRFLAMHGKCRELIGQHPGPSGRIQCRPARTQLPFLHPRRTPRMAGDAGELQKYEGLVLRQVPAMTAGASFPRSSSRKRMKYLFLHIAVHNF